MPRGSGGGTSCGGVHATSPDERAPRTCPAGQDLRERLRCFLARQSRGGSLARWTTLVGLLMRPRDPRQRTAVTVPTRSWLTPAMDLDAHWPPLWCHHL